MKLVPISEHPDAAKILYDLLAERTPEQSISHKRMPTAEDHLAFIAYHDPKSEVASHYAYEDWCLIEEWCDLENSCADVIVGAIYLTQANEIGISIFQKWQGGGLAPQAVKLLMEKHGPRRYLANVAPANHYSQRMFHRLGFKLVQLTFALEAE